MSFERVKVEVTIRQLSRDYHQVGSLALYFLAIIIWVVSKMQRSEEIARELMMVEKHKSTGLSPGS